MRQAVRAGFDLEAYLRETRPPVEAALRRALERWGPELEPATAKAVEHGVLGGGKHLRPVLCVAAWEACGRAPRPAAFDLAVSLELIHAYSLMHDDLPCMDDAPLRRGRPTTHRIHGEERTIVAGAALIPIAAAQAWHACVELGLPGAQRRTVVGTLLRAAGAGGMVGGQVLDLLSEDRTLAAPELDRVHRLKTGALLTAALTVGGLAAGVEASTVRALEAYGRSVGLAFQIADDVLDATATADELGKHPSDAELNKSTYVGLHGLERARARAAEEVERALAALDEAAIDSPPLRALARYVVSRGH